MTHRIRGADAAFDIVWDASGIPHIFATTVADAYRGMGYAAGYERLWQIHLSTAYANGEAAQLLGERFFNQDALQRACNVDGAATGLIASPGDWIADAYLDGLNAYVRSLDEIPPEFAHAGATPREFNRADIAARYRFTCWFQHKSWTEKMVLGRLMATHGVDWFRHHVLHFSDADAAQIRTLREPLTNLDVRALELAYPMQVPPGLSGSNNWAVTGRLSASGKPMLATDPHQPHSIPSTFFYAHLHAGNWDAFGTAFPGVPYFMMGYTRRVAWGLTTGFIDNYDIYVEQTRGGDEVRTPTGWAPIDRRTVTIGIKGGESREVDIKSTPHGPLLEPLLGNLGLGNGGGEYQTALHWSLTDVATSAGALARLPLAATAAEFGEFLFEGDVCPLVNNIVCVDRDDGLERYIAATLPARKRVTGSVPLTGWDAGHDFPRSRAADLAVESNPERGYAFTANNDTMGQRGPYFIHNFPAGSARADRIDSLLDGRHDLDDAYFRSMQLDTRDLRAAETVPALIEALRASDDDNVALACEVLAAWDFDTTVDAAAPCLYYPFLDRFWPRRFMLKVLEDDLLKVLPAGAPGLNRFDLATFSAPGSPWLAHRATLEATIAEVMATVVQRVRESLGDDPTAWRWGDLHQIHFWHSLARHDPWAHLTVGPDEIGGSATTLGMAVHMGSGPGVDSDEVPCRVFHGPAYRLIVDLADPDHASFVIAGGNGGRPDSPYTHNQYATWLAGEYGRLSFIRDELTADATWHVAP